MTTKDKQPVAEATAASESDHSQDTGPDSADAPHWQDWLSIRNVLSASALILSLVLTLSWLELSDTNISLQLTASEITIVIDEPGETRDLLLEELDWNGLATVTMPDGEQRQVTWVQIIGSGSPITFTGLALHDGTEVAVAVAPDEKSRYRVVYNVSAMEFHVPPNGEFIDDTGETYVNEERFPRKIQLLDMEGAAHLAFTTVGERVRFAEMLRIRGVGFWRFVAMTQGGPEARLSTIRHGLLILNEAGGSEVQLRDNQSLVIEGLDGLIPTLELTGSGLQLQFVGDVSEVLTGHAPHDRSLMPSVLQWLGSMPAIRAFLAVLVALFGLSIPLIQNRLG